MAEVERWQLAPDLSISRVVTGLWQIADMERDGRQLDTAAAVEAMNRYADEGFTTFDMADHYGSAEEVAGRFASARGHATVETLTKWVPEPGASSHDQVRTAVERALTRLQTDRLDLLQYHTWSYADPSYFDTLDYLAELRREGLISHLGLTNVDTAHLAMMLHSGVELVSNQVSFSLLDQRALRNGMLDLCATHDVSVLAFGAVAGGFLTERWLGQPEPDWDALETWSQMKYGRFIREAGGWDRLQCLAAAIRAVALRHDASMANVACRWVLDQPAVGGVIVGARLGQSDHRADNLGVFGLSLDDNDRRELQAAADQLSPIPGDCGDEYRRPPFLTAAGDLSDHLDKLPPPYAARPQGSGTHVLSGTVWEDLAGFSRAVRRGDRILVSGTTATHGDRQIGGTDPGSQTHFIIDKIEGALSSLGAELRDVVRTRIFIRNEQDWEPVSRAHGARFGSIQPANTLVRADLIGDGYLVEMEAEAIVSRSSEHE